MQRGLTRLQPHSGACTKQGEEILNLARSFSDAMLFKCGQHFCSRWHAEGHDIAGVKPCGPTREPNWQGGQECPRTSVALCLVASRRMRSILFSATTERAEAASW